MCAFLINKLTRVPGYVISRLWAWLSDEDMIHEYIIFHCGTDTELTLRNGKNRTQHTIVCYTPLTV